MSLPTIALLLAPLVAGAQPPPPQLTLDWPAIAEKIVERLALQPGERVLAVAHPGRFEELVPHLRYAVMQAGGVDLGVIEVLAEPVPEAWDAAVLERALPAARSALRDSFRHFDAAVMLPGTVPSQPAYGALQDLLHEGSGRTIHFHWESGALPLPGQPLPPRHAIDAAFERALLETDYAALAEKQAEFEAAARGAEIRVTTPAGTDLRFRIGDRPVNRQDGDASAARAGRGVILIDREIELPAGAVRVAPLEESVQGRIVFPPSQWAGRPVEGLALEIHDGRVVGVEAASGGPAAVAEMDAAGPGGRAFREFALGFNPMLAVPERQPWVPYYGYGAGVVRLSLGDNSELGGRVGGGYVRWNFFVDASVRVGDQVWVDEGRLVR
jgi:hypothetical protein